MEVQSLTTRQVAIDALREYKANRNVYDKRDWEIERIYRAISKGKTVISVQRAIVSAGLDERKRPRLAICEAHAEQCIVRMDHHDCVSFGTFDPKGSNWQHGTRRILIPWPGLGYAVPVSSARLPRIPPQYRPARGNLSAYHLLWEADWNDLPPADPMLLKRIGKDAWVVLAAWELTEVELSVLRAHRAQ